MTISLRDVSDVSAFLYFTDFLLQAVTQTHSLYELGFDSDWLIADQSCRKNVIKMNPYENMYLRKRFFTGTYKTLNRSGVHLVVIYTEAMDMSHRVLSLTGALGQGHTTPGGIRKKNGP